MSRLADARATVPRILDAESGSLPASARGAVIAHAELTSTGVAVLMLAPDGEAPSMVVKMPMTPQAAGGLEREADALAALHAEGRLGEWRRMIPTPCTSGKIGTQPYRVDVALAGSPVLDRVRDGAARAQMLETAAATIHVLHRTTATKMSGDLGLASRWIDAHVDELSRRGGRRRSLARGLGRLRRELNDALSGATLDAGWIHGDYWLGNLLFAGGTPDQMFHAFDATSGKLLWEFKTSSGVEGPPSSFEIDGKQYIAVLTGWGADANGAGGTVARLLGEPVPTVKMLAAVYVFAVD